MFLRHKPLNGERNLLAAILIAILSTGCAGLQLGPVTQSTPAALAAAGDDSPTAAAGDLVPEPEANPVPANVVDGLDIEHEMELHALAAQRLQQESLIVAEIEASVEQMRERRDAWHRLRLGMRLAPVDNKRVRAQLQWYLEHPGYLQRVMERARPILPFVLDELEKKNLPTELALLPVVEST